jgi:GDP-L-fucose synthase
LTNFEEVTELFNQHRPKHVIHLAAEVAGIGGNSIHSGQYYRNNVLINTNVLEAARVFKVNKLVSFMSTCIFPVAAPYPLNERDLHGGPPHDSNFGYAYAKRMLEVQSTAYRREWGCDFICAIPANMYGTNDYWNLHEGHVVPSLIHKCYQAMQSGSSLSVWGSGTPLREFVFADDIAKLTIWMLHHYSDHSPMILSSGQEISIRNLVQSVADLMGFKGSISWDSTKPDGQLRKPSDTTKLNLLLPDYRFTSLEVGLKQTIEWFLANYPNIRC